MAVSRSREGALPDTPLKTLGSNIPSPLAAAAALDPSTPPRPDAPPAPPSPSLPLPESTPATDGSSAPPARRRSLRLAGVSAPIPSPLPEGAGRRKRASSSPAVKAIGETESQGNVQAAEARVSEIPLPPAEASDRDASETGGPGTALNRVLDLELSLSGGRYMSLRSGSRISRGGVDGSGGHSREEKGKGKVVNEVDAVNTGGHEEAEETHFGKKPKFSAEEKGKGKLVIDDDWLSIGKTGIELEEEPIVVEEAEDQEEAEEHLTEGIAAKQIDTEPVRELMSSRRDSDRRRAMDLASQFAYFKSEKEEANEEDSDESSSDAGQVDEDWPGPFSTAMKIIEQRTNLLIARQSKSASKNNKGNEVKIQWEPTKDQKRRPARRAAPSLKKLCLEVLCKNAEEIESLDGVPDVLKHELISMLCNSSKMTAYVLGLVTKGSPTKLLLSSCTWATEEEIEGVLAGCNTRNLKVIQLDLCGRCVTDYIWRGILARSPEGFPSLTMLSLWGAYRLSDDGLNAIAASAPLLSSINLRECSLLTSDGIKGLTDKLDTVLRELYIDDFQNVDAMAILPALKKLKHLEVLSVAGIQTVSDKFVKKLLSFSGSNIRELNFAGCCKLSDVSMKVIGENCSQLSSLDLRDLRRLTDSAIGYVANGCRSIQKLKLRSNGFSDEAVAAFLEASGEALTELSLNKIVKVAHHTAVAISRRCSATLKVLDLSFCRIVSDEALGLIVDSCSNLRILKVVGCTQITTNFWEGHSNFEVSIIGLDRSILEQLKGPDFL